MSIYSTFILQGIPFGVMVSKSNKTIARQLQTPFFKSGLIDSSMISANVQSLKAVAVAVEGVLN